MIVGVDDNISTRGTILIYGLKYVLPGDKYDLGKSLCGRFPGMLVGMNRNDWGINRNGRFTGLPEVIIRNEGYNSMEYTKTNRQAWRLNLRAQPA